jgi:hypothetical protein
MEGIERVPQLYLKQNLIQKVTNANVVTPIKVEYSKHGY